MPHSPDVRTRGADVSKQVMALCRQATAVSKARHELWNLASRSELTEHETTCLSEAVVALHHTGQHCRMSFGTIGVDPDAVAPGWIAALCTVCGQGFKAGTYRQAAQFLREHYDSQHGFRSTCTRCGVRVYAANADALAVALLDHYDELHAGEGAAQ